MPSEVVADAAGLADAVAHAGWDEQLRRQLFELLRRAECQAEDPVRFRELVRWPLVLALLRDVDGHRVHLADGLVFDVTPDSRIERALLLSPAALPDHAWEPQTTKLLVGLSVEARHVVIGGAYIGDHVLPVARAADGTGAVHAFEPMDRPFKRLCQHVEINGLTNVFPHKLGLWDRSNVSLAVEGDLALASSSVWVGEADVDRGREIVPSIALSDYAEVHELARIDLIMLDTEGGEERALLGARRLLAQPPGQAPNVVFEVHRRFVDWSRGLENTSIVELLRSNGYHVFAIRDLHGNYPMPDQPIEIIPVECVYLEGPPHGFNMLAVKDLDLVISRLSLEVVEGVSPKLIPEKDPVLHHPRRGFHSLVAS
jgi:FkbM family methyltransferase